MVHETKLAFRLPKSLKRRINKEAKQRFISEADVAREAIIAFFSDPKSSANGNRKGVAA
jgi:predicted DNA-binding protein